ncbi:hypothetical protein LLT7_07430, partial [Lactococcus cremoris subsp. cremoris TIFN7]
MTGIKPNFADIARRYNCDYRTVKRYYDLGKEKTLEEASKRRVPPSLIENYKSIIEDKLKLGLLCALNLLLHPTKRLSRLIYDR